VSEERRDEPNDRAAGRPGEASRAGDAERPLEPRDWEETRGETQQEQQHCQVGLRCRGHVLASRGLGAVPSSR